MTKAKALINYLRLEMQKIQKQFQDSRQFNVFDITEEHEGVFSKFVTTENSMMMCTFWNENVVETYAYHPEINRVFFLTHDYSYDFARGLIEEMGWHEYAHSLTFPNCLDCFPQSLQKLEVCDGFSTHYLESMYQDFWALHLAKEKLIGKGIPGRYLRFLLDEIRITKVDSLAEGPEINFKNLLELLNKSTPFFIYDGWNRLKRVFEEKKLDAVLQLFYVVNFGFEQIFKDKTDLHKQNRAIRNFAAFLDTLNYRQIILQNDTPGQLKRESFIKRVILTIR